MKILARSRGLVDALLGAYLALSPWILGTTWDVKSWANASIVGICLVEVALWRMLVTDSLVARWAKLSLGGWLLAAPFVLGFADRAATLTTCVVAALVLASTDTQRIASELLASWRATYLRYQAHTMTPQDIANLSGLEGPMTPEQLARQIVESSDQIRRTLLEEPSGLEVETCALGYRRCTENVITLVQLIDEELGKSNSIRRRRLRAALRRATYSLSLTREVFRSEDLRVTHQKRL